MRFCLILISFLTTWSSVLHAQENKSLDSIFHKLNPQAFADVIAKKTQNLERKLLEKSIKTLDKLQQQEKKIYRKLLLTSDSLVAKQKIKELDKKYAELKNNLKRPVMGQAKQYIPQLDSLSSSLKFLSENNVGGKVKDALEKTTALQNRFQQSEEIKKFIKERKAQLKEQLERLGMVKQLKHFNKQVYYYSAQVNEYREVLKDTKKIEKKALEILSKTKIWKDFFKKNSMLASLFHFPSDPNDASSMVNLSGLQSRAQINNLLQQQVAMGGMNVQQMFQQNLRMGRSPLSELRNRVDQIGNGSNDDIIPEGFKPNTQKTKPFLKRLEFGMNLQSQKGNVYFVNSSDLAMSIGYKLNVKSIIGIGASYKIGLGRGWNAIRITSEGLGVRSFVDWKMTGNFWVTGGYEQNYRSSFSDFDQLKDKSYWQQSGLLGVSKKYKVSKKYNGKMQLLWDFMSYNQIPRSQPIIFRLGFSLK
jgi:hypothetical protein